MKEVILLTLLAVAAFLYFHNSAPTPVALVTETVPLPHANVASVIIPGPSSYNRWKTGPNAQTEFEPFAPGEQANWNLHPGYTIVGGGRFRLH